MNTEFIFYMEDFIKDETKHKTDGDKPDVTLQDLSYKSMKIFSKVAFESPVGTFECYYRIPFVLYGDRASAFYKSLKKDIYHIELFDDKPISWCKLL